MLLLRKIKKYILKYGLIKCIVLSFKYISSRIILFLKKTQNLCIEIFRNDYYIVRSSIALPLYNKNWGDSVNKILINLISPQTIIIEDSESWNIRKKKNYLCIGSIISWMTTDSSIIWGSGVVYPKDIISAKPHKVLAVRGPLSRRYLLENGIECPEIYGDPALLFPKYYKPETKKKYRYGLIPHFRDKENKIFKSLKYKEEEILFIDVQNVLDWRSFIDKINMCDNILSSSLHGIIISDAYNVPNLWIEFKDGESKRFAFHDYFLSVSKNIDSPVIINESFIFEEIQSYLAKWEPPRIDIENLLSVFPFTK